MRIDEAVFAFLKADAGVAGLVGTRVYKLRVPQKPTKPCIRFFRAGGTEEYSHSGNTNWAMVRFQIDCMAMDEATAHAVYAAARAAFDAFSQPSVMGGSGGVRVDEITVNAPIDGWDDDLELTVVHFDVEISHER